MPQMNSFDLYEVLAYVFLWVTLYFSLCLLNSGRSYEWHCRTVTVIHAVVISCLGYYCTFVLGPWPFTDSGGPNTPMQVRTVGLCLGYFLFDFTWCLYFKTEGPIMVVHHFLSIVGLSWCLLAGKYGTELVTTVLGAEITNPLLQLRWFLRQLKYQHTIWADIVEWSFMAIFGVVRLGIGSALLYSYYNQDTDFMGRFGGTCIYSIGVVFYINILNYAINKYIRRYQAWAKKRTGGTREKKVEDQQSSGILHHRQDASGSAEEEKVVAGEEIVPEKDLPTQREIKDGLRELSVRRNCAVQKTD